MDCYIFRWRSEYDIYTAKHGGIDANVHPRIRSGGYTLRDRYVAYYIGAAGDGLGGVPTKAGTSSPAGTSSGACPRSSRRGWRACSRR